MLEPEAVAEIKDWVTRYRDEWQRIKGSQPGLQLVQSEEGGSTFFLTKSKDGFYEQIVMARLPQLVIVSTGKTTTRRLRDAEKPWDKRRVALTPDEVDTVLLAWSKGKSALTLPFIAAVQKRDGTIVYRT